MKGRSILLLAAIILGVACSSTARADSWFEVGVEPWNTQISGNLSFPKSQFPNATVTFRDQLNMGRHWNPNFHIVWHNSVPFLPNVRVEYGTLLSDGSASRTLCYDGTYYQGQIVSQVALKLARIQFYWDPVDNSVVDLRAGVDFRWVSLNTSATGDVQQGTSGCPPTSGSTTTTVRKSKSAGVVTWLPEANLGVTFHLPAHFNIFVNGSGLPYASSYLYDFRLGFNYHFTAGLILGVGYRRWRLHMDNSDWSIKGDLDFKGPYVSLSWRF